MITGEIIVAGTVNIDGEKLTGVFVECDTSELQNNRKMMYKEAFILDRVEYHAQIKLGSLVSQLQKVEEEYSGTVKRLEDRVSVLEMQVLGYQDEIRKQALAKNVENK
jgi:hypothetical protein